MNSKSQSCDRCHKTVNAYLQARQVHPKVIRKPQSYVVKKFQQLYDEDRKWRDKKKAEIQKITKQKEDKQIEACTFKPEINNNPEYQVGNDPFLKREYDWKRHLDKKIEQKREQEKSRKQKDLTFKPKITESTLTNSQVKKTKAAVEINGYSTKSYYVQKKSYKVLHTERKKFKQITKAITVEPFKHRLQNSMTSTNKLQNFMQTETKKQESKYRTQQKGRFKTQADYSYQKQSDEKHEEQVDQIPIEQQHENVQDLKVKQNKMLKQLQETRQQKQAEHKYEIPKTQHKQKEQPTQKQQQVENEQDKVEKEKEQIQKEQDNLQKDQNIEKDQENQEKINNHEENEENVQNEHQMGNQFGGIQFQLETGINEHRQDDVDDGDEIQTF